MVEPVVKKLTNKEVEPITLSPPRWHIKSKKLKRKKRRVKKAGGIRNFQVVAELKKNNKIDQSQ